MLKSTQFCTKRIKEIARQLSVSKFATWSSIFFLKDILFNKMVTYLHILYSSNKSQVLLGKPQLVVTMKWYWIVNFMEQILH